MDAQGQKSDDPARQDDGGRILTLRIAIALLFSLALTIICLKAAVDAAQHSILAERQDITRYKIMEIDTLIDSYQKGNGAPPPSISQLGVVMEDGWDRPFIYQVHGSQYLVISYGRDGKPGGTGLNCEIASNNLDPPACTQTLSDIYDDPDSRDLVQTAAATSIPAFLLCFITVRPRRLTGKDALLLCLRIGFTFLAAVYVGICITALHVPSGH